MSPDPVHIPENSPDVQRWDDQRHGKVSYRLLVDADYGPTSGLVQGLCYFEEGDREALHHHDVHETVHVVSGGGVAEFENNRIPLHPGDTLYVPPGIPHAWTAMEEKMTLLFTFGADRLSEVAYHFEEEDAA
ncbi:cupin domain-containing protein [Histidinibacterium aquaticum]|uniref:Cupin domain-containing protein n=1 Tax=Histidinibacterium aquaticum TaxID=2613962 RepID=A0A5J5GBC2_9RHOB|nr:cupin domain-containing protein [Histidinibacterium aquaticum]KAA9005240.1 cupin domain-containing protein [Histidinibacterium aquaticum]